MAYKLNLPVASGALRNFVVNCAPNFGAHSQVQGLLITFDDVTQQNKASHFLATRDPLAGCLNRRAFYKAFDIEFAKARQEGTELSCLMADIDHFKLVNDNYG